MPMYEYKCECGYGFEDLNRMSERHQAECIVCGRMAKMKISAPRLDPNMDTPGARMKWRAGAERRGRGRDMTSANKTVGDYTTLSDAHAERQRRGENKIIKT